MRILPSTLLALVLFTACGSSGTTPPPTDGATGADAGPAPMDSAPAADTGTAADSVAADGSPAADVGPVVTYQEVKPIFATKCVPCHVTGGQGAQFHTLAESYDSANKPSGACAPKKIGECTLELVKVGYMPFMKGCTGDPAKDSANAACLTAAEQQKLADWIAGGLLENNTRVQWHRGVY